MIRGRNVLSHHLFSLEGGPCGKLHIITVKSAANEPLGAILE